MNLKDMSAGNAALQKVLINHHWITFSLIFILLLFQFHLSAHSAVVPVKEKEKLDSNWDLSVEFNHNMNSGIGDSIIAATGGQQLAISGPKFNGTLPSVIHYGMEYKGEIKVKSESPFETAITVKNVPDWLTFQTGVFSNIIAGSTTLGTANGTGLAARFFAPCALALDPEGTLYIADQADNRIRKMDVSGMVSTVAGSISQGFKDGSVLEARFDSPFGIAISQSGTLFISDQGNNSIRTISPNGVVQTFAGSKTAGYADGSGQAAKFKLPAGICIDSKGVIYVADQGNHRIRMISPEGIVSTLAGSGQPGFADGKGTAAKFHAPTGIAVDSAGYVFVTDLVNNRIRKISPNGVVTTLAGSGEFSKVDGEGKIAAFRYPTGIVIDPMGGLYITDQSNHIVRRVTASGQVSTLIPEPGGKTEPAGSASFKNPMAICFNKEGNLIVADFNNHCIKEISAEATLTGVPGKKHVGTYDLVINATDHDKSASLEKSIVVKDAISPTIASTLPVNLATGINRNTELVITFDEEIKLNNQGSVTLSDGQKVLRYELGKALNDKILALSPDFRSIVLNIKDLPAAANLLVTVEDGIVSDVSGNLFTSDSLTPLTWSFTTKPKEKQVIDLTNLSAKTYGDSVFSIGPLLSSAGLPVTYSAEDPTMVQINNNSAKMLRAGNTKIIAVQSGNGDYLEERVELPLSIQPRIIVIRPIPGQYMFYGEVVPTIKFEIMSGMLLNKDNFIGSLQKAPGDSVGVYPVTIGTLTLGDNYSLKLENEAFKVKINPLVADNRPLVTCTNLITANADGINDSFVARNIEQFPENELKIIDRGGAIVFRTRNYQNNWDGTYRGSYLPVGTYYYHLDLGKKNGTLYGYITLVQ